MHNNDDREVSRTFTFEFMSAQMKKILATLKVFKSKIWLLVFWGQDVNIQHNVSPPTPWSSLGPPDDDDDDDVEDDDDDDESN